MHELCITVSLHITLLQDVAAFLEEMETTDVLLDAILKSQNVRVTVSTLTLYLLVYKT